MRETKGTNEQNKNEMVVCLPSILDLYSTVYTTTFYL